MFETQKIDSFFSGEKNLLDEEEKIFITRRMKVVRFFKLFLPCLTALLLGLGVVLFDFETNNDSPFVLADEEKIYFEKFRMKNTVFEITEKNNKQSTLKADIVEEIEAGKKLYQLTKPNVKTLSKDKIITLSALNGIYNQNAQILDLKNNVVSNYDDMMEAKTNSATYNFAKEYGFGNEKIVGNGQKGNFEADKFTFDKKRGILTLIGHVFMKSDDKTLETPDKVILYTNENKFTAYKAVLNKEKDILKGDIINVFFKDMKAFEIERANSNGHTEIYSGGKKVFAELGEYDANTGLIKLFNQVKIVDSDGYTATADNGIYDTRKKTFTLVDNVNIQNTDGYTATAKKGVYNLAKKTFALENSVRIVQNSNIITAPKAIYFQNKNEFRFYDNVKVAQDDGVATAKSGVYFIKKNIAELENDVVITKKGNMVRGDKAIADFNTSKSRLIAKKGNRIFGKLLEGSLKNKGDK